DSAGDLGRDCARRRLQACTRNGFCRLLSSAEAPGACRADVHQYRQRASTHDLWRTAGRHVDRRFERCRGQPRGHPQDLLETALAQARLTVAKRSLSESLLEFFATYNAGRHLRAHEADGNPWHLVDAYLAYRKIKPDVPGPLLNRLDRALAELRRRRP